MVDVGSAMYPDCIINFLHVCMYVCMYVVFQGPCSRVSHGPFICSRGGSNMDELNPK